MMIDDVLVLVDDLVVALDCYFIALEKGGPQWHLDENKQLIQQLIQQIKYHGLGHRAML